MASDVQPIVESTFPPGGGTVALPVGDNILDFWTGTIRYADGSVDRLESYLQQQSTLFGDPSGAHMHSIYFEADQQVSIQFEWYSDGSRKQGTWWTFPANTAVNRNNTAFQRITIRTTVDNTNIHLGASTDPNTIISISALEIQSINICNTIDVDGDTYFTSAIGVGGNDTESISGLSHTEIMINELILCSRQNLEYRIAVFSSNTFTPDTFEGYFDLNLPDDGEEILDASGNTWYCVNACKMGKDLYCPNNQLHLMLFNKSPTTAKIAGENGAINMTFRYSPRE